MATRGINISSGIGTGEAQVIGMPQTERALWRQLELKRQNQKVEKDKFYENLAKIDTKGIKNQDVSKFENLRNDIINKYQSLNSAKSREERVKYKTELEQAKSRLELEANRSRQAAEFDKQLAEQAWKNWDNFDDETRRKIQYNQSLPSDHPDYKMDFFAFLPQADDVNVNETFKRIKQGALRKGNQFDISPSGVQGIYTTQRQASFDPQAEFTLAKNEYEGDRKIRNKYASRYNLLSEEQKQKIGSPFELYFAEYMSSRGEPEAELGLRSTPTTNVNINNAPSATTGLPASSAPTKINVMSYNKLSGEPTSSLPATTLKTITFRPLNLQITKSSSLRDVNTLERVQGTGVMNVSVGQMDLVPVYKKGVRLQTDKGARDADGLIVPDRVLDKAIEQGVVEYRVIVPLQDKDDESIVYRGNAKDIVESAQFLSEGGKEDKAYIMQQFNEFNNLAKAENDRISKLKKTQGSGKTTQPKKQTAPNQNNKKSIPGF